MTLIDKTQTLQGFGKHVSKKFRLDLIIILIVIYTWKPLGS